MNEPWKIVHSVLDKHRGLPKKLAGMTDKCEETYSSHGREPKTQNAIANGNVSPVTHIMRYARLYEAAERSAGRMLIHRLYVALESEFCEGCDCDQPELECAVIDETADVQKWLARYDIPTASRHALVQFVDECKDAEEQIGYAKAQAIARLKIPAHVDSSVRDSVKNHPSVKERTGNGGRAR